MIIYRNTFRILRQVEAFLSIPCYDYAAVAEVTDADHPPSRKPVTLQDKVSLSLIHIHSLKSYISNLLDLSLWSWIKESLWL